MLHKKARPKRKSRLLRISNTITNNIITCKGYFNNLFSKLSSLLLDIKYTSISNKFNNKLGLTLLNSIPVLSIFVLLGIMGYGTIVIGFREVDGEVYAAESTSNNTSLIIDNGTATDSTATVRNGVAYSSHTVQVKADNITGYTLSITGPASLSNSGTTISGAGGKTGSTMNDNTWGYGWNTTSTTDANMTYNSFTGNAQTLSGDSVASNAVNFTRKLVFAAKFNQNAAEGHYRANVKLNLAVTPKALTADFSVNYNLNGGTGGPENMSLATNDPAFTSYTYTIPDVWPAKAGHEFKGYSDDGSTTVKYQPGQTIILATSNPSVTLTAIFKLVFNGITTMQAMTATICNNADIGDTSVLKDTRDNKTYTIRKLADAKCWMVDNLKLDLSTITLTSADSNVSSTYTAGTAQNVTNKADWAGDGSNVAQFNMDGFESADYKPSYGYYYTRYAAVASTVKTGTATYSICPKNWFLPSGTSSGDFQALYRVYTTAEWTSVNNMNGRWLGASTASAGGAFFLAAGNIRSGGLLNPDSNGRYWTRNADGSGRAYILSFASNNIEAANNYDVNQKYNGNTIRCVAYSS